MKLEEYFDRYGINVEKFRKMANINRKTLMRIIDGEDCLLSTALIIEEATDGKVTCEDMRPTKVKQKTKAKSSK